MKRFIVFTLIVIVFLNSLALTLFFVIHSHNNFNSMRNRQIEDIEQQLIDRLESFHVLIQPFEKRAREYNESALREIYRELIELTKGNPLSAANETLETLVEPYAGVDLYIVDESGTVIKSTFQSDVGLNLLGLDENFSEFIKSVYGQGQIFTQRLGISNMKGNKMLYSYFSPRESNWILETSVDFEAFMRQNYSNTLYTHLFETFFTEIQHSHSDIAAFDIIYQTEVSARSFISGREYDFGEKVLQTLDADGAYRERDGNVLRIYRKRSASRSGFDFVQFPILFIEYNLSSYYDFLTKFYIIAGLSALVLIGLFSGVAYKLVESKLVRRIEELDEVLQRAAYEDYNVRVRYNSRIPELMTLSTSANRLIEQVKSREYDLRVALQEREMLLDEIHHRVKNNLNVVISLLNLQHEQVHTVEDVKEALLKTRNRIYSMALTHEKLYQSENFTDVNMKTYVDSFLSTFNSSIGDQPHIVIESEVEEENLSITHAVPCGIILNELLMNAVQHAFDGRDEGLIRVAFSKQSENEYMLSVEDNGHGLPDDFSVHNTGSLGLILVDALIQQLHGKLTIKGNGGSRFEIVFRVNDSESNSLRRYN